MAVCAGWTLWRAGQEASLWQDEVYSLAVATQGPARIVALAGRDVHPPGYYLALGRWLAAGRAAGLEPGVLWARSLHVGLWLLVVAAVYLATRRLVDPGAAPLLAVSLACGAPAVRWALELRGGAFVFAASTLALLLLVADLAEPADRLGRRAAQWTAYALAAAGAAWSHLLAIPLFALLGLGWAALAWRRSRGERATRFAPAVLAHLAAGLLVLPWAVAALGQLDTLARSGTGWMTAATWPQLTAVFTHWLPFGRLLDPASAPVALRVLGVAAAVVPLAALVLGRAAWGHAEAEQSRTGEALDEPRADAFDLRAARDLAGLGLGVTAAFVILLWGLARFGVAPVFHAPRYPVLAGGLWSLGLGAAAGLAGGPGGRLRRVGAWIRIAPWIVCGLVGQVLLGLDEPRRGLARAEGELAVALTGRPVFAFPSELLPFYRRTLAPYAVRPIDELPCGIVESAEGAVVLDLDPWPGLDGARDRLVARSLRPGALARSIHRIALPPGDPLVTVHALRGLDRDRLAALCERGWRPAGIEPPAGAVAVALPEDQTRADGWSRLEIAGDLASGRWGSAPVSVLRLPGPIAAGRYRLHVLGERSPHPRAVERMRVVPPEGPSVVRAIGAGPFELDVPIEISRPREGLRVAIHHPVWRPAEALGTRDRRRLTFYLRGAWLEGRP